MKRRDFIKTGLMTAGSLLIPDKADSLENLVSGRVIDTLSEAPVYGAKLKFYDSNNNVVYEAESDENGIYPTGVDVKYDKWKNVKKLYNDASEFDSLRKIALEKRIAKRASNGILKLEINHDDYFDAVRYIDLSKNEFNSDIIPKTFDMELFDMWCRDPALGGSTQRWSEQPKWYIYTGTDYTDGVEITQDKIGMVENIIQNDLVQFSRVVGNGSFISNPVIEKGKNIPEDLNGMVLVGWDDSGGPGYHGEDLDGNRIYSAMVAFNLTGPIRGVYLEELTQVLGPRTETETRYFFGDYYAPVGLEIGKILYSRPIGSISPDINPKP